MNHAFRRTKQPAASAGRAFLPLGALATSMLLAPLGALAADETAPPQVNVQDDRLTTRPRATRAAPPAWARLINWPRTCHRP